MSKDYVPLSGRVEAVYVGYTEDHGFDSREEAEKQFRRYEKQIKAEAWDEALELLQNNSEIDLDDLEHYKQLNPYREAADDQ